MRARIIRSKGDPALVEAGVAHTRDVLIPAAQRHEGYRGYFALYDAAAGTGLAVTLWEDERTEQLSDDAIRPSREQAARDWGIEVTVEKYDVGAADWLSGPAAQP